MLIAVVEEVMLLVKQYVEKLPKKRVVVVEKPQAFGSAGFGQRAWSWREGGKSSRVRPTSWGVCYGR
jgi:hypothetical protein